MEMKSDRRKIKNQKDWGETSGEMGAQQWGIWQKDGIREILSQASRSALEGEGHVYCKKAAEDPGGKQSESQSAAKVSKKDRSKILTKDAFPEE